MKAKPTPPSSKILELHRAYNKHNLVFLAHVKHWQGGSQELYRCACGLFVFGNDWSDRPFSLLLDSTRPNNSFQMDAWAQGSASKEVARSWARYKRIAKILEYDVDSIGEYWGVEAS